MMHHRQQNPLYTHFEDLCDIMREYDVTWSLGDGLRPGSLADASDAAQFAELDVLGELTQRAWAKNTQVMIEGPGHIPMDQIEMNVKRQMRGLPRGAVLRAGAAGDRHRAGLRPHHQRHRRGAGRLERRGDALLRDAEGAPGPAGERRREAGGDRLQDRRPRRRHGPARPAARERDDALSKARFEFDWNEQFRLSLDPETARRMHDETLPQDTFKSAHFCSMCGPKFCSMKITEDIRADGSRAGLAHGLAQELRAAAEKGTVPDGLETDRSTAQSGRRHRHCRQHGHQPHNDDPHTRVHLQFAGLPGRRQFSPVGEAMSAPFALGGKLRHEGFVANRAERE